MGRMPQIILHLGFCASGPHDADITKSLVLVILLHQKQECGRVLLFTKTGTFFTFSQGPCERILFQTAVCSKGG